MKTNTVAYGYNQDLILYYPTVKRLKLYVENLNMLITNYLFYSENDRIISKLSVIRCQNTLNFQITLEHLQKKLIRFNLLFHFVNPERPPGGL
jgi:hypothetical protein